MRGQYKGFISENIAPKGVSTISIYDSANVKRASMKVPAFMKYPTETPLYKFGVISDSHATTSCTGLDFALNYLKQNGAEFVCHCGDVTNIGFYPSNGAKNPVQFETYKNITDKYVDDVFKVYCIAGNHESYYKAITEDLDSFKQYTGCDLHYSVTKGNDVFLFIGQPGGAVLMTDEAFNWLSTQLETNKNKRCFLFIHPYIPNDSGNPLSLYGNNVVGEYSKKTEFLNLLKHYKNVTIFHGHSHFRFEIQELDKATNYTNKNGFRSVHVPSCTKAAVVTYDTSGNPTRQQVEGNSQAYLVEVFSNCIVLNGVDFSLANNTRNAVLIPAGIIKLDTTLQTIS